MKKIKYQYPSCEVNIGTEEAPVMKQILVEKVMPWTEETEAIARREALNSVYEIYDDGEGEIQPTPTLETRVATLEESNAEMTETLDMILSGVTSDA